MTNRPRTAGSGGRPFAAALLASWVAAAGAADPASSSPGNVRFFRGARSSFDRYTADPSTALREWMRSRYWRLLTYAPYFDSRLSWFPDAWMYKDLYAVYVGSPLASEHPEWILHDAADVRLYIPYGCSNGTCPQYAGDVGAPAFRAHWLDEAAARLAKGYRGLFVDDVNMTLSRVADGAGRAAAPIDRRTGLPMTESDWRRYMADFTEEIRARFPAVEVVHNPLWFVGHDDPAVQRQLLSADFVNLERGVNDAGIRSGTGRYGFGTFLAHVDWLHGQGRSVVFDAGAKTDQAREYGLAAYFLLATGRDAIGNGAGGTPDDWWSGYDVSLGSARGARFLWQGVLRRDFENGLVLVNPPDATVAVVELDEPSVDPAGQVRSSLTLGPAQGAVLRRASLLTAKVVPDAR